MMNFFGINISKTSLVKEQHLNSQINALLNFNTANRDMLQQSWNSESKNKRSFHAASGGNLYASWIAANTTADVDIKKDLKKVRARSRQLMRDDDYAKKFKRMVKTNVIGTNGIKLQNRAKKQNGDFDKDANDIIESAWKKFCKKGVCDVTGKYSMVDLLNMCMGTLAEDGEVLVRKVRGFDNEFSFSLQLLEADHLDEQYSDPHKNIMMGIEFDQWDKPIAYHISKSHPGNQIYSVQNTQRERIPAEDIIHLFLPLRISATRGMPWMHSAMTRMKMVNGYEEAELVAARLAASKAGFYTQKPDGDGEYHGDDIQAGTPVNEVTPGEFEVLPVGMGFETYDPQHPNAAFKDFMKVVLRGISSGLDVSYNTLANDLEGVNFSSLRSGVLDEREVWKYLQKFISEHLLDDVFADWLDMGLLTKAIPLSYLQYDKYNNPSWLPRGFAWVDPLKDAMQAVFLNKNGKKTDASFFAEQGLDRDEVYAELAAEAELKKDLEITTYSDAEIMNLMASTIKKDGDD